MVYRDYWALSQWYAHYGRKIGSANLFIVAHGCDDRISEICPDASVITIPRDDLTGFDAMRGRLLNSIQDGLGVVYDWVIRTDVDELICIDPAQYASFADMFRLHSGSTAIFALGFNLVEGPKDRVLQSSDRVFGRRRNAVFSGHYSKAWAARRGVPLVRHGIGVPHGSVASATFDMPAGVYLAHLKYANIEALSEANQHRMQIGSGGQRGLPGKAWSEADKDTLKFYRKFAQLPLKRWPKASELARHQLIEAPVRDARQNVLRARSINFPFRTLLPEWFKDN